MNGAQQIQHEREASDLENHRQRVTWLSAPEPKWSCGTRVDSHTRHVLLLQSKAAIEAHAQRPTGHKES
jgi:hypothetical protein